MTKRRLISILVLTAAVALPGAAASGPTSITAAQVANAISGSGMKVSAQQVTLLADVVATTSNPVLQVESVEPWGEHRLRVRLSCESSDQCVPFLVAVRWGDGDAVQPSAKTPSLRPASLASSKTSQNSFVVHNGSPAVLLLDGDHVHIRLSVICLENGAPGQTIRVEAKDHSRTFTAQVQDATY